jgi:two-component sensor histidine kinase
MLNISHITNFAPKFYYKYLIYISIPIFILLFFGCKLKDTQTKSISYSTDTAFIHQSIKKANSFKQINFDSLFFYGNLALQKSIAVHYKFGEAKSLHVVATYYRRKGNYPLALNYAQQVANICDSLKKIKDFVEAKFLLANIYKEMGGEKGVVSYLDEALKQAKEASKISTQNNYKVGEIAALNMQGIILKDIANNNGQKQLYDTVFNFYRKAIELIRLSGENNEDLQKLHNNIAQIYYLHYKNYAKALAHLDTSTKMNLKENTPLGLTYNYDATSSTYLAMGNYDLANEYGHKMLALSQSLKTPFRVLDAYNVLLRTNKEMGRNDSALYFMEKATALNDSMNNLKKTAQIAEMQTKYETQKKEDEILKLNITNKSKNKRLFFASGLALLLLGISSIFLIQKKRLQKQKKVISEQSDRLQWMMKELHHRVKNNLQIVSSLLNLQTYRLKDEESISAIKESQLRVQAMSLMHQRLYQVDDVSLVNFKLYLTDLIETLMKSYGIDSDNFKLNLTIENEMLDVDTVMPMGLLVNEIITNAFKYAYTDIKHPSLTISLKNNDKQLQLHVADNGIGMNNAVASSNGFGKKLISALTKQLKATCKVQANNGTHYDILIPYQQNKAA